MARGSHAPKRHTRAALIVAVAAGVLLLALAGVAYGAYRYELSHADRILPGVRIAGVDVGGLTRLEATQLVSAQAERILAERFTVTAADSHYIVTPADLGKRADVESAVDRAFAAGENLSTLGRFWHRFRHDPMGVDVSLSFEVQGDGIDVLVRRMAGDVAQQPRDAEIVPNQGLTDVRKIHAQTGRRLMEERAAAAIGSALAEGLTAVEVPVREVQPKITDDSLGATIVVRIDRNRLELYVGFKRVGSYDVATAKPGYTTPVGLWTIWDKRVDPTWYNPALDSWGAGLPAVVPGGPGNPMGPRAIYIDAPGLIRIHGTTDDASIGRYASHGCIRMHNADVIELFERVEIGDHVVVVGYRPASAGYWSVPAASDI
jgi:lipoprotein-anchoring transpeptidase ErfK/SrfK